MNPIPTAVARHYLDAYAGLVPVLLVTLLAVYASTSGSVVFLASWSVTRMAGRALRLLVKESV
ncbi:MAG TPA: hypothetical protein DD444_02240 [Citreicella sp.]|jgi:predicted phosphatase|nr:hypothetical protein [Citreicella sp.]|tara:strand:- start:805 stop:993 length:189 start_codon:yes stop_codon:yes gene_type:complete